jgi:hypothetical protein
MSRAAVGVVAVLGLAGYVFIYSTGRASVPIRSDGFSYYVYLPSWFIHADPSLVTTARDCCGGHFPDYTGIVRWPGTRRWVNSHPIGVALMQAPLFFVAHALTWWTNLSPDGFSFYYQHAVGLSGLVWGLAGLWMLRTFLLRHFSVSVTAAALIATTFGTNFFHYLTFDSSFSHAYSFFLVTAFLSLIVEWHRSASRRVSLLLGLTAGMLVLTRHTNALVLMVFPLYGLMSGVSLRGILARAAIHRSRVLEIAIAGGLVLVPQTLIYWSATGRPLVNAYGDMGFDFAAPKIGSVLFSVEKGLFFWSPILLLSLAGWAWIVVSGHQLRAFALACAIVLAAQTYVIASWWAWHFGSSYGHRGFVDILPLFAIGLAGLFAGSAERRALLPVVATLSAAAIALCSFQMLQCWHKIIPMEGTTWETYRSVFLQWR